jgi:hypothetical protein
MAGNDVPPPRLFTVEEARALLPRLREILARMRSARDQVTRAQAQITERFQGARVNGHFKPGGEGTRLEEQAQEAQKDIARCVLEIATLGCELKDPGRGMVDFRTLRDGRVVYLCWLAEEPDILYWHELDGGARGRQRL